MRDDERALVARMQAGDREALGEIYRTYARRVYAFALRRLRDPVEAEDVCQDVFVEVARSIGSFEGRSSLATWILGIAHHEVCNQRRCLCRRPVSLEEQASEASPSNAASIDRQVDAARALARCSDVLGHEVGAAHREVFELYLGGARDLATIADTVGRSPQAVKISLFRTRRKLHRRVAGLSEVLEPA